MSDTVEVGSPNLNQFVSTPKLDDLLTLFERQILLNFNCHHVGTIQSFDPVTQKATVLVAYKRTYWTRIPNNDKGVYSPKQVDYPPIIDCPVFVLGGGNQYLSFAIKPGDECMVLFNDRDFDNWYSYSQVTPVATGRLHSFSDGAVLVGLRSFNHSISGYDMARAIFGNSLMAYVGVSDTKVKIANTLFTLKGVLDDLIDQIKAIIVNTSTGAVTPTSQAALEAIKTEIASLLE